MSEDNRKLAGIRQIVRLKQLLQKWQYDTLGKTSTPLTTAAIVGRSCDSDEDSNHSPQPPADVPKGYVPVYVGQEKQRRFVIPTTYLSSPVFKLLLQKAEEEFGFDHMGALNLPCEIEAFKYILQVTEQHQTGLINEEGNPTATDKEE